MHYDGCTSTQKRPPHLSVLRFFCAITLWPGRVAEYNTLRGNMPRATFEALVRPGLQLLTGGFSIKTQKESPMSNITPENRLQAVLQQLSLVKSHDYIDILSACDGLLGSTRIIESCENDDSSCSDLDKNRLISGQSALAHLISLRIERIGYVLEAAEELLQEIQSQQQRIAA